MTDLYYRIQLNVDAITLPSGTISEWEKVPAEGIPSVGVTPEDIVNIGASLTLLEQTGAKSIAFDNFLFTLEYTYDPSSVAAQATE